MWQLPDVREPVAAADDGHVDLADADNAMVPYRESMRLLRRNDELIRGLERLPPGGWDWATASPAVRAWAEENRPALAAWLAGTQRRDCLVVQPGEIPRPDDQGLATLLYREFAILAALEATRRQAAGDLPGAWELHLARFRSGLLAGRHAGLTAQVTATMILARCPPAVTAWAADPALTADLVRRAIRDLIACRPLVTTPGDVVRHEYIVGRARLADPAYWTNGWDGARTDPASVWYNHVVGVPELVRFWKNEPKRSLKVYRLITTGFLAQCDRPPGTGPRLLVPDFAIFAVDPSTPPAVARIKPEALVAWAEASGVRGVVSNYAWGMSAVTTSQGRLDELLLIVARRAFALDHGGRPPATYADLFPGYLDALPPSHRAGVSAPAAVTAARRLRRTFRYRAGAPWFWRPKYPRKGGSGRVSVARARSVSRTWTPLFQTSTRVPRARTVERFHCVGRVRRVRGRGGVAVKRPGAVAVGDRPGRPASATPGRSATARSGRGS